jgi:phosphoribosyl-ATP pyrophosphohydrolase/phosphoribosyl-AMP cyclohydrolase
MNIQLADLKFDEHGLIPAIVQNAQSREVLTLAYMNTESLARTIETKQTWFWSRSRNELWHKGETSGNTQRVVDIIRDCDGDALVVLVEPAGPACHTGARSCFEDSAMPEQSNLDGLLAQLYEVVKDREQKRPPNSYTTYLFSEGLDKILKKVGEESAETIVAAKNEAVEPLIAEVSDLLYHLVVLMVARGVSLDQIRTELAKRRAGGGTRAN